jgi:hypothetical protein
MKTGVEKTEISRTIMDLPGDKPLFPNLSSGKIGITL